MDVKQQHNNNKSRIGMRLSVKKKEIYWRSVCFVLFCVASIISCYRWFNNGALVGVVIVLSDEPRQNQGRGLVDRKQVKAPPPPSSSFIAGRPKAALLLWLSVI